MADVDRRLGLVAATGLALIAAGCLAGDAPTATAEGLLGDARDAAEERVDDPSLVRVHGVEPFRHEVEDHGDERSEFWIHLDDDNGDGESPGWLYRFRDGTTRYMVAVHASGEVLGEALEERSSPSEDDDPAPPVEGWEVDTDEVAEALSDHPEWTTTPENESVQWSLSMEDGEPLWRVAQSQGVFLSSGRQEALVHAGNGTVLGVQEEDGSFEGPEDGVDREHDQERSSGTVSPSDTVEASIELEGPGRVEGILDVEDSDLDAGAGSVTFELLRDEEVRRSTTVEGSGGETVNLTVENAEPGEWTARASTDDDVRDVTVTIRGTWTE